MRQRTDIIAGNMLVLPLFETVLVRYWASEQAAVSTEISFQQEYRSNGTSRKAYLAFVLRLPGVTLPKRVTVTPFASAVRLIAALNKKRIVLQTCDLQAYRVAISMIAPPLTPHLFLPKMTIITNNDRDIPPEVQASYN